MATVATAADDTQDADGDEHPAIDRGRLAHLLCARRHPFEGAVEEDAQRHCFEEVAGVVPVQRLERRVQAVSAAYQRQHADDERGDDDQVVAVSCKRPATVMPRRLETTATPRRPTIQREATQAGSPNTCASALPTMNASEAMTRMIVDEVGEGDGQGDAVVHGALHVEADGGRGREHPVELAEEAVGEEREGSGDDDGNPGGVARHIHHQPRGGQVLQGGERQARRGGDHGAQAQRTRRVARDERDAAASVIGGRFRDRGRPPWRWRRSA